MVVANLKFVLFAVGFVAVTLFICGSDAALDCSQCAYVIPVGGGTYTIVNNVLLGLAPGSVVCWSANYKYTTGMMLQNFTGTASQRFVFTNCNGTVVLDSGYHAIITMYSQYLRVTGKYQDNDPVSYGLRITKSAKGVAFESGSTYVELDHVELTNAIGHAAVVAKTDPDAEGGNYVRPTFTMRDVWLHHNYIHDVEEEAFYIGYYNFEGSNAHEIVGLRVYANIIKNTGFDGIQVGAAISDTKVYNNYVTNFGTSNTIYQQAGLMLIGGMKGEVYGNRIDTGTGIGILYQGNLDTTIYNNVVLNAALGGISASISGNPRYQQGTWTAYHHNTVVGFNGQTGLNVYITLTPHTPHFENNVIIGAGTCANVGTLPTSNLCATAVTNAMGFTNAGAGDYSIITGSSLINKGVTCAPTPITTDYNGGARDSQPDLGAFEEGTTPRDDGDGSTADGSDGSDGGGGGAASALRAPLAFIF